MLIAITHSPKHIFGPVMAYSKHEPPWELQETMLGRLQKKDKPTDNGNL